MTKKIEKKSIKRIILIKKKGGGEHHKTFFRYETNLIIKILLPKIQKNTKKYKIKRYLDYFFCTN